MGASQTLKCPCGHSFDLPDGSESAEIPCPACKNPLKAPPAAPPRASETQVIEETLGKIILMKGWVKPDQIEAAVMLQADLAAKGEKVRLGEVLIQLGALTPEQVREALLTQDKVTMRCPACNKNFNVRKYKPGTRVLCKTCSSPLVLLATTANVPVSDTSAGELRNTPVGKEVDASLSDLIPGYRIERRIGSGGMGDVYLARQASLDRLVAIKILPPEMAQDANYVGKFLSEAKSAARVTHENIVAAVDAGEAGGRYYFVMEYVDGETVSQVIKREGALEEKLALQIARQVAKGLRHAHRQGLIHRDIKPSNVMMTADGTAKICDFGLARSTKELDLTQPGIVQSSPAYASPEQCRGQKDLDHRTDMYSLGVTLFEMLTGVKPFEGETPNMLFIKHVTEPPPSPRTRNPDVSMAASQLVLRLLRKQANARFADYDQLIEAIESLTQPRAARPSVRQAVPQETAPVPLWKRPPFIGAAAGVAFALVLAIALLTGKGSGKDGGDGAGEKPPEPAVSKLPPEIESALREAKEAELRATGDPSQYPSVRALWTKHEVRYRGTPHHPAFASGLVQFNARVSTEADLAAQRAIEETGLKEAAGQRAEAILALRRFPAGFAGTEASSRIAARLAAAERTLDERYAFGKEEFFTLLSREKWDDARRQIESLRSLVMAGGEFARPQYRDDLDNLGRRIDEEMLLAKRRNAEKTDPKPPPDSGSASATGEPPKDGPPPPPPPPPPSGPVVAADHLALLRSAALRSDPVRRAAAADAFARVPSPSALHRAVAVFLLHGDRAWKLSHDRLTVQTEHVTYENLVGEIRPGEDDTRVFEATNGVRVSILRDGRISISGRAPAKPVKLDLQEDIKSPVVAPLDEYLASLPLDRPEPISAARHQEYLVMLAKKIAAAGSNYVDALQLFACAHIEDLLSPGQRPGEDAIRQARLMAARSTDAWGPADAIGRISIARILLKPGTILEIKRALDGASSSPDFGTRFLAALAVFLEDEFDPRAVSDTFRKLALQAKDTPIGEFCDTISKETKEAQWCKDCKGEGRYPCRTCTATGLAVCSACRGAGSVPFGGQYGDGGLTPCKTCRQKGKVICPTCGGGRMARCATCEGKKVLKTVPTGEFRSCISTRLCKACEGTGSVFPRMMFPCPLCEGLGRFPKK